MNTTVIKEAPDSVNWLEVSQAEGYVAIRRVFADGTKVPASTIFPKEVAQLADLLSKREAA